MVDIIKEWGLDIRGLSSIVGKNENEFLFFHPDILESQYSKLIANCPKMYSENPNSKLIYFDLPDPIIVYPNFKMFKIRWSFMDEDRPLIVDHIGGKLFICYHAGEFYLFANNSNGDRLNNNFISYERNGCNMITMNKRHVDGNYKYLLTDYGLIKKFQGELKKTFPESGYYITYLDNGLNVWSYVLFNNKGEAIKASNNCKSLISYYQKNVNNIHINNDEIHDLKIFEKLIVSIAKMIPKLNNIDTDNLKDLVNYAYSKNLHIVMNLKNMQIYSNYQEKTMVAAKENRNMQLARVKKAR